MVEEIYTEELPEAPPQTPQVEGGGGENTHLKSIFDELNPKYKIAKDYKEFEEFMKDKNNRKALFDELNPKAKIAKDFNEFEGFLNIGTPQPKEASPATTQAVPKEQITPVDILRTTFAEYNRTKKDPNSYQELEKPIGLGISDVIAGTNNVVGNTQDDKKIAEEKYSAAKKDIATQYNLKEDAVDFALKNLESYAGNNFVLDVAKEYNDNPYAGERKVAAINYQIPLNQALKEKVKNNEITKGTYDDIWRNFLASQRSTTMSNSQKRDALKGTLMLLREHLPYEQANELSKYVIKDGANVYGNMGKGDIEEERKTIENSEELGDNAIRTLAFLKDTDPNSYNKYIDIVIPKYALQTEEQILAWESKQKELEEIGLNLKYRRDAENLKNLENKIKKGDYTEADLLQYNKAIEVNNENIAEFDKIKEKFPKAARYDLEFIAQELLGEQPLNEIGLFGVNLADNILDIPKGVGSLLSSPFRSKEEAQLDRLQTSGESKTNAVLNNRLESRKSSTNIGGVVEVLDSDIQAKIDEIKKSNNEYWYKISQIKNLLSENPKAYTINKEKKKETNSFREKIGSVADLTSELLPEVVMALTGAEGARLLTGVKLGTKGQFLNNAFAEFTTSYQDNKEQAIAEGLTEEDALRRTIVQSVVSGIGDEFGAVMKAVRRLPKKYSSLFDNFTEKEFNKFLQGKAFSKLENIGLAVKDIAAGSAKTAAIGVGANIANDIIEGKDIDWSEKAKQFKDMAVDMGLLSTIARGIGAIKNFKDISDDRLLGIFDVATKPEEYKSILKTNVDNGKISKDDAINILNRIDAVSKVYNETSFTDVNGNLLSESKKIKMFGDVLRKNELVKESSTNVAPIRKEAIEKELGLIDERMNKLAEESPEQYIIDGKEVTKEEFIKTDLTDKKWRINNGDARLIERTIDKFGGAFDKTQLDSAYDKSNVKKAEPKQEESELYSNNDLTKKKENDTTDTNTLPKKKGKEESQIPSTEVIERVGENNEFKPTKESSVDEAKPIEVVQASEEVKAEQPTVSETPTASDVESTAKALQGKSTGLIEASLLDKIAGNAIIGKSAKETIAEEYHKDKKAGNETELVKAVESLLSKEQTKTQPNVSEIEPLEIIDLGDKLENESGFLSEEEQRKGYTPVTLSGMTEAERKAEIEARAGKKMSEKQKEENYLADLAKKADALSYNAKKDAQTNLRQIIRKLNADAGYEKYKYNGVKVQKRTNIKTGALKGSTRWTSIGVKYVETGNTSIVENGTVLRDRSVEVQERYEQLMDILPNLKVPDASNKQTLSEEQIKAAIQDVNDGIPSVAAENLLNTLESGLEKGVFDWRGGEPIRLKDLIDQEEVTSVFDEKGLEDWLNEGSKLTLENEQILLDNIENILYEYAEETDVKGEVQVNEPATKIGSDKKAKPNSESQKPNGKNEGVKTENTKPKEEIPKDKVEPTKQQTSAKPKEKASVDVEKVKKIADFIRKGKIDDDILMSGVPFAKEVWNGAVEAMAKTVELTGDIAKAIEDGIAHIKKSDWYKSLSEENKAKAENRFNKEYSQEKINEKIDGEPKDKAEPKADTNFLNDKNIPLTDEKITALSADTSEYTGVKVSNELRESTKASLDLLQQEGAKWVAEAKEIYNNDNTTYVTKMIRAIKNIDGTNNLSVTKKAVAVVSLLESIDKDLMYVKLSKAERETMVASRNYLLGLRANLVKDVSLALNAQRLIYKMYNGKYKTKEVVGRMVGAEKAEFVDEVVANMEKFDVEITQDAIDFVQKEVSKPFESETTTKATKTAPITENQVTKNRKKYANILKNTVSESQYEKLKNEIRDISKKIICPQNKK